MIFESSCKTMSACCSITFNLFLRSNVPGTSRTWMVGCNGLEREVLSGSEVSDSGVFFCFDSVGLGLR